MIKTITDKTANMQTWLKVKRETRGIAMEDAVVLSPEGNTALINKASPNISWVVSEKKRNLTDINEQQRDDHINTS